ELSLYRRDLVSSLQERCHRFPIESADIERVCSRPELNEILRNAWHIAVIVCDRYARLLSQACRRCQRRSADSEEQNTVDATRDGCPDVGELGRRLVVGVVDDHLAAEGCDGCLGSLHRSLEVFDGSGLNVGDGFAFQARYLPFELRVDTPVAPARRES